MYNMNVCHLQYFVLVVLIFAMEIVAGVLSFIYRHDIENFLYKELMTGIHEHYPHESQPDVDGLRTTWGFLQTEVRTTFNRRPLLDQTFVCPVQCISQHWTEYEIS